MRFVLMERSGSVDSASVMRFIFFMWGDDVGYISYDKQVARTAL